jgi:hypothetical protein
VDKLSDGECSASEKTRAEAHLTECETCREHYRFLKALPEAAQSSPLPDPPEAYWELLPGKIMARIERETAKESKGWLAVWFTSGYLKWAGAMAAVVVAAVIGLEVADRWQPSDENPNISTASTSVSDRETEPDPPGTAIDPEEILEQAQPTVPKPPEKRRLSQADEPQPEPAAPPSRARERDANEVAPRAVPAPSAPPPPTDSRGSAEESQAEPLPNRVPTAAPGPTSGRAPGGKEEVASLAAAREIEEPRAKQVVSLQEATAVDEVTAERSGIEAEVEDKVAFSLEQRQLPSSKKGLRATSIETSDRSESELLTLCKSLRDYLESYPDSAGSLEARYRLARCSINLFQLGPTEDRRRQAVEDGEAFVEAAPEDERAEEINRFISSLKESKNN